MFDSLAPTMTLEEALAEFATTRSHELGDEIEELGQEAIEAFTPPTGKNVAIQWSWLQLVKDPRDRSWCLRKVIDKLPKLLDGKEHPSGDLCEALVERLNALAKVPPDPRIVRAMFALHELRAPVLGFVVSMEALIRCVIAHADDRTQDAPEIKEWAADAGHAALFATVKWPTRAKPRAKPAPSKKKQDTTALFAAVYAAPDSDEPREILADALQEAGDPRGEFIALQLREHRGDPSEELRDRAQAICDEHGKSWLGPLAPITFRAQMRRGFVQRLELDGSWTSDRWDELAQLPMLATIEELASGKATAKIYAPFLGGAIAKTVRSVEVFENAIWSAIATKPMPRLDQLLISHWGRKDPNERFKTMIAPWLVEHPQVTRLGVADAKMVGLIPKPVVARLRHLTVGCAQAAGAKLWAAWPKLHSLTITPSDGEIRFIREGNSETAHVVLAPTWGGPPPKLTLPKTIKRLELTNNIRASKLMVKTYQRRYAVAIVKQPSGRITGVK